MQDGRVLGQEGSVVGQGELVASVDLFDQRAEGHVSVRLMVAVDLSVGSRVDQQGVGLVRSYSRSALCRKWPKLMPLARSG